MHSAEDLGVVGDFGAICKTSKTPVSGAGPHSDICGKTSFFCLYLVLVWVFSPLMTSFFLIFGINATRCKQASNNRQVLLCLFVISTSSSSKFTFCLSNFFFVLPSCKSFSFLAAISTSCAILLALLALQPFLQSCASDHNPECVGVGCLQPSRALCLASCSGRFVTLSASTLKE